MPEDTACSPMAGTPQGGAGNDCAATAVPDMSCTAAPPSSAELASSGPPERLQLLAAPAEVEPASTVRLMEPPSVIDSKDASHESTKQAAPASDDAADAPDAMGPRDP